MEIALAIRTINFILWTLVVIRIFRHDRPVDRLTRQLFSVVLIFGMGVLAVGSLSPFDILPDGSTRMMYTVFTAFAGLIALAIITTKDGD